MDWQNFLQKWISEFSSIGTKYFVAASVVFFLFYFVLRNNVLHRKIQSAFPKMKDYRRDIFYSVISMCVFAGIGVLTFTILMPFTNIYSNIEDHSRLYYYATFVWMFFLHDAYFYWTHRFMHHPKIFKYVHLIHHKSTNPSPWTAYAFHPLEAVIEALIIIVIAFTLPVHHTAITIYMLFQIGYNVYGHLGFEIFPQNMSRHWLGKYVNTSVAHNMHHKYFVKNYSLWTTIWDRMMGTLHPRYDEVYDKTTKSVKGMAEIKQEFKGSNVVFPNEKKANSKNVIN